MVKNKQLTTNDRPNRLQRPITEDHDSKEILSFDFAQDGEQFGPERIRQTHRPELVEGLTAEGLVEPFRISSLEIINLTMLSV